MYNFDYTRPVDLDTASAAFEAADDSQYLAGGQTLIPVLKQRLAMPSRVIDLAGVADLKGISVTAETVSIGAMTCHADVASSGEVCGAIPALAELAGAIGDPQVRNLGTLGGSIANNDPAADYPAAVLGLGAMVLTDRRKIAGNDFFTGFFETALEEGELVIRVDFPVPEGAAYVKLPNPASRYAVVGVFVAKVEGGVKVAVTGAGICVFRTTTMEVTLAESMTADALQGIAVPPGGLNSDIHASAEYRAHLVGVLARRAVEKLAAGGA